MCMHACQRVCVLCVCARVCMCACACVYVHAGVSPCAGVCVRMCLSARARVEGEGGGEWKGGKWDLEYIYKIYFSTVNDIKMHATQTKALTAVTITVMAY